MSAVNITIPQHKRPPSGGRIRKRLIFLRKNAFSEAAQLPKKPWHYMPLLPKPQGKNKITRETAHVRKRHMCAKTAEAVRVGKLSDGTFKHLADVLVKNEIGLSV